MSSRGADRADARTTASRTPAGERPRGTQLGTRLGTRLGPRPLPAHLAAAIWTWTNSYAAWPAWRNGWLPWRDPATAAQTTERQSTGSQATGTQSTGTQTTGGKTTGGKTTAAAGPDRAAGASRDADPAAGRETLRRAVASADPEAFDAALRRQLLHRHVELLRGIQAYRQHPYTRPLSDPPAIWREGTTRLLDYGQCPEAANRQGPPVLVVPSLINRAYILDLKPGLSLVRDLAARGYRPLLVDWDRPGEEERGFDLTAYIAGRLERALDATVGVAGGQGVPVLGYCMGGLLALALAERRPREVRALALLATPWDFHAHPAGARYGQGPQARLAATGAQALEPAMQALGQLPVDALQMLFAGLDPLTAVRKFLTFARLDPDSARAETFVALEDWLNDGVPLAAPVARECLYGWYGANTTAEGGWRVAGRPVDPGRVAAPALCLLPANDRIVPPASAAALGAQLPHVDVRRPALGHIGMVVSNRAPKETWAPLADWLDRQAGAGGGQGK
jgi:polyhydroxyalkanoate synthase